MKKKLNPVLGIAVVLILLWTLIPFYSLVVISLVPKGSLGKIFPGLFTFEFYKEILFGFSPIWKYMGNSAIVCLAATTIILIIVLPCGYGLSRWNSNTSRWIYSSFFILRMIPPISFVIPWFFILNRLRLIDTWLALVIVYIPLQLSVGVWLMKGFFDTIPKELEESAWIDGAAIGQTFRKIVLPLAMHGVAVTAIFVFIGCYIEFMYASILTRRVAVTLPPYIAGFATPWEIHYQKMLAASLLATVPMIALYSIAQKYIIKGLTGGALKF